MATDVATGRSNLTHIAAFLASAAAGIASFGLAFNNPQFGLDAGLLIAGASGLTYAILRFTRSNGPVVHRSRTAVSMLGWVLTGLIIGVTAALGLVPLILVPVFGAVISGGISVWRVRKSLRGDLNVSVGLGRHVEVALIVVAVVAIGVASSAVMAQEGLLVTAMIALLGGTTSLAVAAWNGVRVIRSSRTPLDAAVNIGGTSSVLMLHGLFAALPLLLMIWLSGGTL